MSDLRDFFDERKDEVNTYFEFINHVGIDHVGHKTIKFDSVNSLTTTDKLNQVLKSNCILILYNLIEGIVTQSIIYVIDKINDKNLKYEELHSGIKHMMLRTSSKKVTKDFSDMNLDLVRYIDSVFDEVFNVEFDKNIKKRILGGGGDFHDDFIIKNSKKIGIRFRRKENELRNIKNDRNDLAHGSKSYAECSHTKTLREIKKQKTKVFRYLDAYVKAVDKYVDDEKYKV